MNKKVTTGRAQRKELRSFTVHTEDDFALVIGFEVDGFEKYFKSLRTFWGGEVNVHYVVEAGFKFRVLKSAEESRG